MVSRTQPIYEFDGFRLDVAERQLLRDGNPVPLHSKTFEMLRVLVENHGRLLTKDDLFGLVWTDQFVEESNLTVNMSWIRKALGERADHPRYIKTISGQGYRFVADVRELNAQSEEFVLESETFARLTIEHEEIKAGRNGALALAPGHVNKKRAAAALALVLAVLFGFGSYIWQRETQKAGDPAGLQRLFEPNSIKRLTTSGNVSYAALSPDGKLFVHSLNEKGQYSLWLGHTDGGAPVLLRPPADVFYSSLSFAADGNSFYYVQSAVRGWQGALYRSPVFGGVPEKLREDVPSWIAIAPDEKRFAFVRNDEENEKSSIIVADLGGTAGDRELSSRPLDRAFQSGSLSWSPDGSVIAAGAVGDRETGLEVFIVSVAEGSVSQLTTSAWQDVRATTWSKSGSELILSAQEKSYYARQLWQVSLASGEVRPLNPDLNNYGVTLSLSPDNSALLVMQAQNMPNVWVAPADDFRAARQITFGSRRDGWVNLDWMPDGRLVYGATLDNSETIWTMDADGGNQKQLTSAGYVDEQPGVTGDGRYIVFQSNRSGNAEIWRISADGGNLRQLTAGGGNTGPHVAPDGKWIVFTGRDKSLWRIPLNGSEAVRLTEKAASWARISPDSRFIACEYSAEGKTKLAVFSIEGGDPLKLFDVPKSANFRYGIRWTPDGNAVTYRDWFNGLWKQPLSGGKPTRLEGLPEEKLYGYGWSRNGKHFAFVRGAEIRDFVLLRR